MRDSSTDNDGRVILEAIRVRAKELLLHLHLVSFQFRRLFRLPSGVLDIYRNILSRDISVLSTFLMSSSSLIFRVRLRIIFATRKSLIARGIYKGFYNAIP